jgi:hypothetical protein
MLQGTPVKRHPLQPSPDEKSSRTSRHTIVIPAEKDQPRARTLAWLCCLMHRVSLSTEEDVPDDPKDKYRQ